MDSMKKAGAANEHLMKYCVENDIVYLDNSNICLENLTDSGTGLFKRNILDILEVWYTKAYAGALREHRDETSIELDTTHGWAIN